MKKNSLFRNSWTLRKSEELNFNDLPEIKKIIQDLHDTLTDFRNRYQAGRTIAAPQIGCKKRLIYMHIDNTTVFVNLNKIYVKIDWTHNKLVVKYNK
jgi:peptide deformylase